MPVFFNNCRGFDHAENYGRDAFYDLNRRGLQASMALNLKRGTECVVATPNDEGDIDFVWFAFAREKIVPLGGGKSVRVFFGKRLRSDTLTKQEAAKTEPYALYFNVNGDFKQRSEIKPKLKRKKAK